MIKGFVGAWLPSLRQETSPMVHVSKLTPPHGVAIGFPAFAQLTVMIRYDAI